jgi:hypothetical protein
MRWNLLFIGVIAVAAGELPLGWSTMRGYTTKQVLNKGSVSNILLSFLDSTHHYHWGEGGGAFLYG